MKNIKTILGILGLLVIGFVAGFQTNRYLAINKIHEISRMRTQSGLQKHLLKDIELTAEQQEKIDPIVNKYTGRIVEVNKNLRQQKSPIIDSMHSDIREILTPDQVEKMDKKIEDFKNRWSRQRKDHSSKSKKEPRTEDTEFKK